MCTKDRRERERERESRSVCLTELNQNSHKKFRNSSLTNLERKARGYNDSTFVKRLLSVFDARI